MPQQLPDWVVNIQTATKTEVRSQPWKAVVQDHGSQGKDDRDHYNVQREPVATRNVVG